MKKRCYTLIIIFLIFNILCTSNCLGFTKEFETEEHSTKYIVTKYDGDSDSNRKKKLKKELSYNGDLTKEIKVKTKITIKEKLKYLDKQGVKYKVKFRRKREKCMERGETKNCWRS